MKPNQTFRYTVFALLVLGEADWDVVGEIATANDGRAGVLAYLTYRTLKLERVFQHFLIDFAAVFELLLEFRHETVAILQVDFDIDLLEALLIALGDRYLLSRIVGIIHLFLLFEHLEARFQLIELGVERIDLLHPFAQTVRNHLGETVRLVYRETADAGDVLDGALRSHCSESDDTGNVVGLVFVLNILVGEGQILKIDINIRHRDTVRIQETLEQQ